MRSLLTIFTMAGVLSLPWLLIQTSEAQTSQAENSQTSFDCTQLSIEEVDDALLTKAERLALMDKNLQTSMDKYDQCMSATQQQMAGGGSSSGGGQGGGGQGSGNSANAGQRSDGNQAQGQQTEQTANNTSSQQQSSSQQGATQPSSQGPSTTNRPRQLSEPKDNDSIICKLLWQEIQSATPDKIEGFTKQYDDYKCG